MLWGRAPWGGAPWTREAYSDESTLPPFVGLLADPDLPRVHIALLQPYDPVAGGVVQKAYADRHWEGGAPAAPIRLNVALDVESAIAERELGVVGGGVTPRAGSIFIHADETGNPPHELAPSDIDALTSYWWDLRAVEVRLLGETFSFSQGQPVFVGFSEDAVWSRGGVEIVIRDPALRLAKPIQANKYAGIGTLEGGADLKGKTKPLTFGEAYKVQPVEVDTTGRVYQVHDGAISAISAVYDRGILLTNVGNVADVYAAAPAAGEYVTDISKGIFRLGAPPAGGAGQITADVLGDADAGLGGYEDSPARIFERIVRQRGGLAAADLDLQSFTDLDLLTSGPCGMYIASGEGESEIPTFLDLIFPETVLGFWELTRTGLVRVAAIAFDTPARTLQWSEIERIERVRTAPPIFRWRLGWRRTWHVQSDSDIAASVGSAYRDLAKNEFRYPAPSEDGAIAALRQLPGDVTENTLFADEADAITEQARRLALTKVQRDRYEVEFTRHQFLLRLGDTVTVEWPQWGLGAGRDFLVLSLGENTKTRTTRAVLWG